MAEKTRKLSSPVQSLFPGNKIRHIHSHRDIKIAGFQGRLSGPDKLSCMESDLDLARFCSWKQLGCRQMQFGPDYGWIQSRYSDFIYCYRSACINKDNFKTPLIGPPLPYFNFQQSFL